MMQTMNSAPMRNQSKAADKPSKIKLAGSGGSEARASAEGKAPVKAGPAVQGFGSSGASEARASGSGNAPVAKGQAVAGFSGNGMIKGKI
jgi:hypothetical protein